MSLIKNTIFKEGISTVYYAPRIIPGPLSKVFLEEFVQEKFCIRWVLNQYRLICEDQPWLLLSRNAPDLVVCHKICKSHTMMLFLIEVYYYDSTNLSESKTTYAFRYSFDLDLIKKVLPVVESILEQNKLEPAENLYTLKVEQEKSFYNLLSSLSKDFFTELLNVGSHHLSDPGFKLDKIKVIIGFRK